MRARLFLVLSLIVSVWVSGVSADEATIRKNLTTRLPSLAPIDEISKTPLANLWEVRMGSEIIYTDDQGLFVVEGQIVDLQKQINITQSRIAALTAFDFSALPLTDAVVWKQGTGERKIVIFADPNCGYCKNFERELSSVKNITVYTFLIPILGGDSPEKTTAIWCAKGRDLVWRNWMLNGVAPMPAEKNCDTSALERNVALALKHAVSGTPTVVFADNKRVPGIMTAAQVEQKLGEINFTL
jgi:thiol:disulfide interchange protein DsbC